MVLSTLKQLPIDFEIADLNVRIDNLPHTFPGDITFGFKAPNGYGVDLVTFIGGAVAGGGDGDNITNMVIDNAAVGDMLTAPNAASTIHRQLVTDS